LGSTNLPARTSHSDRRQIHQSIFFSHGSSAFALRARGQSVIAQESGARRGSGPAAAHARQLKRESEAEGAHDFGSSLARAQVGRVSPRPPDRRRSCTLLGREPLLEAKALGLTERWFAGDPAVSERRALPALSPDRQFMLTRMGSRRIQLARWLDASSRRPRGCVVKPPDTAVAIATFATER